MGNRKPILVTGSHRSGTTWVGKILSLSRSVCYIHEPFNIDYPPRIAGRLFDYWFTYISRQNERDFYESLGRVISFRYDLISQLRTVQTRKDFREPLGEFIKFSLARILRLRPLLKDPIALFSAEWLASNFNMNVVVMIRHPAAFVSSIKRLGWNHPFSHFLSQPLLIKEHLSSFEEEIKSYATKEHHIIEQAAFLWNLIHHMIINYQYRHKDWNFIRHEDLSREPFIGFNLLFNKLNLKFSPRVQRRIEKYSDVKNPINSGNPYSIKRNSKSIIKKWQKELSKSEITRIRNKVENISDRFYKDEDW
jgi:hypothetical protein